MLCCLSDIRNPTCVSARTLESQRKVSDLDTRHNRSFSVGAAELVPNSCRFVRHQCDHGWPLLDGDGIRVDIVSNTQIVAMEAMVANTVERFTLVETRAAVKEGNHYLCHAVEIEVNGSILR